MQVRILGKRRMDFVFDEKDADGNKKELHGVSLFCEVLGEKVEGLEGNKVSKITVMDDHPCAQQVKDVKVGNRYTLFFEEGGKRVGYIGAIA